MNTTRQLAAIMFTDLVGYTAMMQENEPLAISRRDKSKEFLEGAMNKYEGTLLQFYGDGTLSIYKSALNAVLSAIEIQTLHCREKIELRIGIHLGDVMFDDTGIYGDSVNVASRIETMAVPGAVFISERMYAEVCNQDIDAMTLGYFELKNVKLAMQVYAVNNPGIVTPLREVVRGKLKETENSIAVLPFVSMSSDPENEFFCDGITEELLNVLAKIEGLRVTSRTSSFAFKGSKTDIREIAAQLNVKKVLEGSVRKAGHKVRITAQLINAADGYHLWSETYDRSLEDIFAIQDEIAREIAYKFRLNLDEHTHTKELVKMATENMEAYRLYLRGIYLWNTQQMDSFRPAMDAFNKAAQLDPGFADPWAYIAFMHYSSGFLGIGSMQEAMENCRQAAANAMSIDPQHPQALLAMSIVKIFHDFDWKGGYELLEKSVALNPNNALTHIILASWHYLMLDKEKALEFCRLAQRIDPLGGFTIGTIAECFNTMGEYEKAFVLCDEILKHTPDNGYILMQHWLARGFRGEWKEVAAEMEEARKEYGDFPLGMSTIGLALIKSGELDKAMEYLRWFEEAQKQQPEVVFDQIGMLYANLGMADKFFKTLEFSVANRSINILWFYQSPHLPEQINQDERFKKIRQKIGLPV